MQDKIVTGAIAAEVREAQPDLNEPTVNAIVDLQKQLNILEDNKTQVAKDRAAQIRADIKNLKENQLPDAVAPTVETTPSLTEELAQSIAAQEQAATTFTDADRARKQELEDGIASARARGITIGENLTNELETLNKKEQDAIQEQAAGQVPVQPTTTVGQEVEQGVSQAEPQVPAQASVQEEVTPAQEEIFTLEDEPAPAAQPQVQEEINEEDIALSGLRDGFKAVTRNSFDLRSDAEVTRNVNSGKSFTTSVTKNGKNM